jgi:hypothetical protein
LSIIKTGSFVSCATMVGRAYVLEADWRHEFGRRILGR